MPAVTANPEHFLPEDYTGFADVITQWDWDETALLAKNATTAQVEKTLAKAAANTTRLTPEEFAVLISPAAEPFLETMAQMAHRFTVEKFGKTISMYIPMYVSNACANACVYCGFNHANPFERTILTMQQVRQECEAIRRLGPFENLLLVSGEFPSLCGTDYFAQVMDVCRPYFHNLTIEVQPMRTSQYRALIEHGLNGVVCFQETYNSQAYNKYHPRGMKSIYSWRLNGYDRMGRAGLHKIGLGVLIGLEDWHAEMVMMARHLRYLQSHYWRSRFSVNFPRMCPSESGFQPNVILTDRQLVQLTCAFRIFDHETDISYSTRELPAFRDGMIPLGVTSMSAGSQTDPGGYAAAPDSLEQFEVSDQRTPAQVAQAIRNKGYEPVWKDWDAAFDRQ